MVGTGSMNGKQGCTKPGDVFVLVLPEPDDADRLRRLQMSLQSVFGGIPHEPVHLTCQRFKMAHNDLFPLYLFTGRWVVLSRILGVREFERFWAMQLTDQIERGSGLYDAISCANCNRGRQGHGSSDSKSTAG